MSAPKVTTTLVDQSTRVNTTGTYNTAIVIAAKKGEINKPIKVTGQTDFLRKFTPNERIEIGWDMAYYEAYQYLKEQNGLYVVRAAHTEDLPTDENDYPVLYGGCVIKRKESENSNISCEQGFADPKKYSFQDDDVLLIYGNNEGAFNNDLSVAIVTDQEEVKLEGAFLIKVYRNKTLLETHTCSLDPSMKNGYGNNCFVETVLESSLYIRALSNAFPNENGKYDQPKEQKVEQLLPLKGGSDGSAVTDADRIKALKTLNNLNDVNIQLVLDGGNTTTTYQKAIQDLCTARNDSCHGIISTKYEDEVNSDPLTAIRKYRKEDLNMNNYSMEMYTPHQMIYDEFNDRNIYISAGPFVASLIMKYATERGWHWAVAGYNRGIVPSLDVAKAFEPSIVDELSDMQINTIVKDPGSGNIIMDELTMQTKASDMQDAHISRYLNIYLRPAIKESLKPFLFEFNDDETRAVITQMLDTFMQPQKSARAVYDYRIVCDESNNSDSDIENNILNCWLYVKPTKIAKWIKQSIIVTPYSVDLSSLS